MKKSVIFLLAAVLLTFSATTTQAQAHISYSDASFLLQKTLGKWQVTKATWNPELKEMNKISGKAIYSPSTSDVSVYEQAELMLADGTSEAEEGHLRYSKSRHQFEFVKKDAATGKEVLLYTGHWYPEYKTILLTAAQVTKDKNQKPNQWRYVFQENGTFTKMVHKANKDGNMILINQYNFKPDIAATAGIN
ncbi:DUF1579 domain-containing protein [Pontibacter qinzhouensis]|uniref:DUF1579 domain-containing protein n=1 Tax=Pontibacter qinzhouensis TaxID=2603253 RepID=A0A5C8K666_9BACT|nr:DUF1579 family protein [Pontibacter qinzhouensis]TXK46816.1 DUF1579 domain-containing protein [Pontibacter qinzhouensis]